MGAPIGRVGEFQVNGTPSDIYVNMNTQRRYIKYSGGDDFFQLQVRVESAKVEMLGLRHPENATKAEVEIAEAKQAALLVKQIGMDKLQDLCAAAFQEYNASGEPVYLYTPGQLGGMLEWADWQRLAPIVLQGVRDFLARSDDLPAVGVAKQEANPTVSSPPENDKISGGLPSTPSDADIADSLTLSSVEAPSEESASDTKPISNDSEVTMAEP